MASTVLRSLVPHLRNAATITRCVLQCNSTPASGSSRSLSTVPSAPFFSNRFSDAQRDLSKYTSPLYTCGSPSHGAVLASGFTPGVFQVRCYENTRFLRLKCEGCYFVWRHGRKCVECSDHPRHKQMKTIATRKHWQEDYSKGDIQKALDWHRRFPREFIRCADRNMVSHNWLASKIGKEV
ncbi:hypothetical protein BsWGS_22425 [Bradybaena similaris]